MKLPSTGRAMRHLNTFSFAAIVVVGVFVFSHFVQAKDNGSAQNFVQKASIGGDFEIASSKIALERSKNPSIQEFAQTMIDDHNRISKKLTSTLPKSSVSITDINEGLDPEHTKKIEALNKVSDSDFDREYAEAQKDAHSEAVNLFQNFAQSGDDEVLKSFAEQMLPTLKHHQEMASRI